MATVSDYGVTENKVRAYVLGELKKLNQKQLTAICNDYLNKVMRKQDKYKAWPKKTQKDMRQIGVHQSTTTGEPIVTARKKKSVDFFSNSDVTEMGKLALELDKAEAKIEELAAEVDALRYGSYEGDKPKTTKTVKLTEAGTKAILEELEKPAKKNKKMAKASKAFKEMQTKDELS